MNMSTARRRLAVVVLVVLAYGCFTAQKLLWAGGDFSVFVVAGDRFFDSAALDTPIAVLPHSNGYDGQFVYRLALDPLTAKATDHGITIDTPSLRAQRIGVPVLAHLLSFGSARLVPFALVMVNIAGIALLTWVSTGIALFYGRPGWHGLVIPLYPGLLLSLSRDTTEIVSTALAVSAVYLALRGRAWSAGLVACAAVLTRETTLLYLMGFGVLVAVAAVGTWRVDRRIVAFLLPVFVLVGWQIVLVDVWGHTSFAEVGNHDFGWPPLRYLVEQIADDVGKLGGPVFRFGAIYYLVTKIFLIVQAGIVAVVVLRGRRTDGRLVLAWIPYLVLATLFTDAVWVEPFGYLRIFADLYVTGCLLLLASPLDRPVRAVLTMAAHRRNLGGAARIQLC